MIGRGRGAEIEVFDRVSYPHSLGVFYSAMTQFLGFPGLGDEYKVMGFAAYGEPRFAAEVARLVPAREESTFALDLRYFRHLAEGVEMTWQEGSPSLGPLFTAKLEELEQCHKDLAASRIQELSQIDRPRNEKA